MGKKLVCLCNFIEEKEIVTALKKGATSTKDIQKLTTAGTSCGRCLTEIDQLVKNWKENQPKDAQKKLNFEF